MRIMGLDYGSVTVGVAISDELHLTTQGIEVIRRKQENKLRQTLARIEQLVKEYEVGKIVLGYPKNLEIVPYFFPACYGMRQKFLTIPVINDIIISQYLDTMISYKEYFVKKFQQKSA